MRLVPVLRYVRVMWTEQRTQVHTWAERAGKLATGPRQTPTYQLRILILGFFSFLYVTTTRSIGIYLVQEPRVAQFETRLHCFRSLAQISSYKHYCRYANLQPYLSYFDRIKLLSKKSILLNIMFLHRWEDFS